MHTIPTNALASTRRSVVAGAALAGCATTKPRAAASDLDAIEADLRAYADFGAKLAGGPGDEACGAWLETRLRRLGYATTRQSISAAFIEARDPHIRIGAARADVVAHCLGAARECGSLERPVVVWSAPHVVPTAPPGAVVVAHLPVQRWSSAQQPAIRDAIARAFACDAGALVLVTHGPTGDLIRLNRPLAASAHATIALLAPRNWPPLQAALAGAQTATLSLHASASERPAFNVTARRERGARRWLVISSPRSGWGACVGERGPGIAALLALAARAPQRFPQLNIALVVASAHEFENAGAAAYLEEIAPAPSETELWLHLGAGFAARDWHEAGGRLLPLPSPDPQRFLVATSDSVELARSAFSGLAGLEAAYDASEGAAGELQNIIAAGYRAIGFFGAHRYHHVAQDDLRCVDAPLVHSVLDRLQRLLEARLS